MIALTRTPGQTKDTVSWAPVADATGFRFTVDGKVSHTWDGSRTSVAVAKAAVNIKVEALGVLDTGVLPNPVPPDPIFPPQWSDFSDDFDPSPSSRWAWEFAGSTVGFPNAGAKLIGNEPGVRLSSPVVGGNGQLSAFYDGTGDWGKNGMRQQGLVDFRLVSQSAFIWIWEWHENQNWIDINSCAVGVNPDRSMRVQISGGQVSSHQYTHLTVPGKPPAQPLVHARVGHHLES